MQTIHQDLGVLLGYFGISFDQPPPPNPGDQDGTITVSPGGGPFIGDPPISATEGVQWTGQVATISDGDADDPRSHGDETVSGTIDWGDGSTSNFSAPVPEGGSYGVEGGHTWQEKGTYTVTVSATDPHGGSGQTTDTVTVSDAQLNWFNGTNAPGYPPTWGQVFEAAPSISTPANQTSTEGDIASLQIQASDSDGDTLSYDAVDLPPGLSINSSTGIISGTVAYGAAEDFDGSYNPTVIVDDGHGGSNQTSFSWTVNQAQVDPVLTNPGNQTNLRGDSVSLQVNATQADSDPVSFDATNLPPGLTIDPDTGLISGTVDPSAMLNTPYAVTVTATDDSTNLSANQSFNWTINATNVAPSLTSPGNQTNSAGDQVSLQLSASDVDSDSLSYTATGLPTGLTLDPIAGTISGTLPNSAASSTPYNVTVAASDSNASSSQSFTWTVNAVSLQNPGDQGNLDGDSVSLQLTASDANNATLTYSATGLPSGLSINSSSGLISGTIASNADTSSPYSVTVTATDSNNDSVNQTFNWTVDRVSLNPVNDQENQEGTSVSLQLSASDNEGTPTYSATGLPAGLSLNSTTGLISGTAGIGAFGSSPYQVTVSATDGTATSSQSFVWTVTPRVALVNPGPHSNATGDTVSLQLSATSPGGTMTYSASGLPAGLSINSGTGLITGSPTAASSTPYSVTVTANDGTSSSSQTFNWTVSAINLVSPGDQTNNDGDTVSLSLTTSYHGTGTLSYSATGLPTGLNISSTTGQITGTISGTADTDSPYSVIVTVTDGTNTSSQTFNWTVNQVVSLNSISTQSNAVGDAVSLQMSASDSENKTITYSATGLPSGLTINSSTGLISGTIAVGADTSSPYAVTVTATDSAGNSATQSFNWTVAHVSLVNPGAQTSLDGATVSLQMQGHDSDGDTVSYTAGGLPSGLSINTSTGLISGTIASNADTNSPYAVTVTAGDGTNTTTQYFLWTVAQVSLSAPSDQTNTEGDTVSLQLQGAKSSGSLAYNASGLPAGLSLNTTTGLISGTITAGDAANGPYTVDVSASNGTVSTSQTFTWTVNPIVNLTQPDDQNNNEGDNVSLQISATDSLNNTLSYSAVGLPSGLSINSSTGLISGSISTGDAANGPYAATVTASDGTYSSSVTINWNITHTDTTALTMTNPGTQVNVTGDSVNFQINASDPDGIDTLIYSATGLPDGLDIDPFAGIISGTVADDASAPTPYAVTVTADDGNGQTISQTFTWIINPAAITATASPVSAVEGNDTGSITVATFTTPDLNSQAADFTATLNWGDGTIDTGTVSGSNGSFTVTDDHVYAEMGSYSVSVTILDTVTGGRALASTTATVADAPLTLTGGFQYGVSVLNPQTNFVLGWLSDGNPSPASNDLHASINWGDGNENTGGISQVDGEYEITGAHSYPQSEHFVGPLAYTVTVTVTDVDGASASVTDTIQVGVLQAGTAASMSNWLFQDQNSYGAASDFTANILWGDGGSNNGAIGGGPGNGSGPVNFSIVGAHLYSQDSVGQSGGRYPINITVNDEEGSTLTGPQEVSVVRPPLTGNADNVVGQPGVALNNVQVAEFTVPDGTDGTGEFSATINWGDGNSGSGTIQEVTPGLFEVLGSHTYNTSDTYIIQVTVSQDWDSAIPAILLMSTAVIGKGPPISGPSVVPGNSNYEYSFTPPDGATNITLIAESADGNKQRNPLVQSEKNKRPGWFKVGFINKGLTYDVTLQGQYTGKDGKVEKTEEFDVTVVPVSVESPPLEKPFVTDLGPIVAGPTGLTPETIDSKTKDVKLLGITPGTKPSKLDVGPAGAANPFTAIFAPKPKGAIRFSADVTLGTSNGNIFPRIASGIDDIELGFMQHLTVKQFTVHMGGIKLTSSQVKDTKNEVLDAASGSQPWFSDYEGAYFQGGEIDQEDLDAFIESFTFGNEIGNRSLLQE